MLRQPMTVANSFHRFAALLISLLPAGLAASPYASAGDVVLRHQVQLLQDEALLDGIATTWPYNLGDLYYNLQEGAYSGSDYWFVGQNLTERLEVENNLGIGQTQLFVNAGTASQPLRTFSSSSRGNLESGVRTPVMGDHYAANVSVAYANNPADDEHLRLDGSYIGVSLWDWTLAVDYVERWWGPGWEGSLILSNNARPFPAVSLTRNVSTASELPVVRWLGSWTFTSFMGILNDDSVQSANNPLFWGLRAEVRPFDCLTIGISRTAQWAGHGRSRSLKTFWNVLIGRDNTGPSLSFADEPGNQLAGMDFRLKPLKKLPAALYGQVVGEDAGGMVPSKLMFLSGVETWGLFRPIDKATWRLHVEYADTSARYNLTGNADDVYSFAYNHHLYRQGYRYKGLSLGHAMDGDGTMLSAGFLLSEEGGRYWGLLLRRTLLNRHSDPSYANVHTVSRSRADVNSAELYGGIPIGAFDLQWSVSWMDYGSAKLIGISSDVQGAVSLSYSF